ncbi:MAG: hypothetical protein IPI04_06025 [Ignavibacteria bacterium]|nr:hypothetical protein [Ignavibacteria bacterium]
MLSSGNYSNGFKGFIDDLRIYKTRHSIQQIANDRGVPVSMDEIANINLLSNSRYSSLTAAWSFNETEMIMSVSKIILFR